MDINIFFNIIGGTFIALGIIFFFFILSFIKLNKEVSHNWIRVKGEIIKSELKEVEENYMYDSDDYYPTDSKAYKAEITYSYSIDNKAIKSKNLYATKLVNLFMDSSDNKSINKKYHKGDIVTIFVNPNKKFKSALIRKIPIVKKGIIAFIFFTIGISIIIFKKNISTFF